MGKIVIGLIAIAFVVGFGMSGSFTGKQNIVAQINNEKITTKEFVDYLQRVNITNEQIEKVGKLNLLQRILTNYISEKIISIESNKKGFHLSDKSLYSKLLSDKKFLKEGEFSETKYEKFILSSGITKPFYESLLKENEIKDQLLNFYSGGLKLPEFIIDDLYKDENRSLKINYISLTKIYKKKEITEKSINEYYEKNKKSFEDTFKKLRYVKLTPENLIGDNVLNEEYFKKLDNIENSILDGESFASITNEFKSKIVNLTYINSEALQENGNEIKDIEADVLEEIFKINQINTPKFINNNNKYFLVEVQDSKDMVLDFSFVGLKDKIKNQIKIINQIEDMGKLINDIEEKKFTRKDLENLSKENNEILKVSSIKNIKDNSIFDYNSLKRIYEFNKGSIFVLPGDKENFLVTIIDEKNPSINKNSSSYKEYVKKANEMYVSKLYKSYDNYINSNYKIDVNTNVLERIGNSF